jgi:hypothetical protein
MSVSVSFGPPRPCAVASVMTSNECVPSIQTLLYSIKTNIHANTNANAYTNAKNYYEPEIITLVTPNISNNIREEIIGVFCTRVIEVGANDERDNESDDDKSSTIKINLFHQKVYDKILYIAPDCLVQKDISHIFYDTSYFVNNNSNNVGLISACTSNDDDHFDTSVMLIQPNDDIYNDMMSVVVPNQMPDIWNTYFHDVWVQLPNNQRLGIEYNHKVGSSSNHDHDVEKKEGSKKGIIIWNYDEMTTGKDQLFQKWYKKSQLFKENYWEEQELVKKGNETFQKNKKQKETRKMKNNNANANVSRDPNEAKKKSMEKHKQVTKLYKQLRKEGKDPKEAMKIARSKYGMDKDDEQQQSPSSQVASMFGLNGI